MKLLSDREKKLLDMLETKGSVKDAAYFICYSDDPGIRDPKMTTAAAYSILYRLRKKYVDARTFVNTILAYRKKSELLRTVLTPVAKESD